jgi:hypothetical protein
MDTLKIIDEAIEYYLEIDEDCMDEQTFIAAAGKLYSALVEARKIIKKSS